MPENVLGAISGSVPTIVFDANRHPLWGCPPNRFFPLLATISKLIIVRLD